MSDDNKFSLGDILWEYADYTPPKAGKAKRPAAPPLAPKGATGQPGITSPQPQQPAQAPTAQPAQGQRPATQPKPQAAPPQPPQASQHPKPGPAQKPTPPQTPKPDPSKQAAPQQQKPAPVQQPQPKGASVGAAAPSGPQPAGQQPPQQPKPERPASQPTPSTEPLPANQAPAGQAQPAQAPEQPGAPQPKGKPVGAADPSGPQPASQPQTQAQPTQAPQQPGAPQPKAEPAGQPQAQAQPAQGPQQPGAPQPKAEPVGAAAPSGPQPAGQPQTQAQPTQPQTGVPQDNGPDLIAFTPDPNAKKPGPAQAAGQPGQTAQQPLKGFGPKAQAGQFSKAFEGFHPFKDRKAKAQAAPPPDAPPAQLSLEYGVGLKPLKNKTIGAAVLAVVLLALAFLDTGILSFLTDLVPEDILLYASLGGFVVCCALAWDVLKDGLVQLTNFTPGSSTLALFAAAFTLADGVTMVLTPLRESAVPFFAPCALVLLFQLIGQYCDRASKFQACRTASSVARPYVVTQDPDVLAGKTGFRKWLGLPKGFGSQIRTTSQADERFQKLTPVLMTACVCLALLTTVAHHQPKLVLWSLSALFTASATLGASLTLSFPLQILGSKLATLGVALAGWPGIAAAKGCRAALLTDNDLYPPGTVTLANSKPLSNLPMDRVVAYTASAIRASGSGLSYLFDKLLRSEGAKYLPIEKILLQDNGLIAQTQGQQILVGNSDFMSKQGIALPTGIKYKNTVFCAVDRELIGMFGVRYALHTTIVPSLQSLLGHRIAPVLVTRDFNINPKRMRFSDRLNKDSLTYPDLQRRVTLSGPNQAHGQTIVAILCREGMAPFTLALIAAKRVRRAAGLSSFFVRLSACVGVILTATLSSAGALGAMSAWHMALFLLLWFVPVLLLSLWTEQY
ncbi:MAG: hypothetical protein Q4A80_01560 [Bacillota bacterium]|nr:hypothetical protein [Bacillota bacterium]